MKQAVLCSVASLSASSSVIATGPVEDRAEELEPFPDLNRPHQPFYFMSPEVIDIVRK